jgi:ankyrin repeat protein
MSNYDNIHDAAWKGTVEDVKYFVEQKGVNVNAKDNTGHTVIQFALLGGNAEIVQYLVSKGADIEPHWIFDAISLEKGSLETVKLFVENGVSVNHRDSGMFPLLLAAGTNNIEVAKFLISKGADINMASSMTGQTPLQLAESKGNMEMIDFLTEQKRKLSPMKIVKIVLIVAGILIFLRACAGCLGI